MSAPTLPAGLLVVALAAGLLAACGSDGDEVARLRTQVQQLTEERDALQGRVDAAGTRHDRTVAVVEGVRAILADPDPAGDEDAVTAALAAYATPDAEMEDDAFHESLGIREAWARTLFDDAMDSRIDVLHSWVSDDGSLSGGLWVWYGTNTAGRPFELVGAHVDSHDDQGRITHELVVYPYTDEYVVEAVSGAGTPRLLTADE